MCIRDSTATDANDEPAQGLINIEDLLCDSENETIFLDFTKKNLIQVTKDTIYIDPFDANGTLVKISPGWEFENVTFSDGTVSYTHLCQPLLFLFLDL